MKQLIEIIEELRLREGAAFLLPGFTHQIALVAKPAWQRCASGWKLLLLSASVKPYSCRTLHKAQSLIADA
jgi:hypothetical protein